MKRTKLKSAVLNVIVNKKLSQTASIVGMREREWTVSRVRRFVNVIKQSSAAS